MDDGNEALGGLVMIVVILFLIGTGINTELEKRGMTWEDLGLQCLKGIVIVIVGIAALVVAGWVLSIAVQHPKEAFVLGTGPIWFPHFVMAWLVVNIARVRPLRYLAFHKDRVTDALMIWLAILPASLGIAWGILGICWLVFMHHWVWWLALVAGGVSTGLLEFFYYRIYFKYPPNVPDWHIFEGALLQAKYEYRANRIMNKLKRTLEGTQARGTK